jgi:hypothetical protein
VGFGVGAIPFIAINAYATRYGIVEIDEFDRFMMLIKAQDSEYLRMRSPKTDNGLLEEVRADDVDGVKRLFSRLAKKPDPPPPPEKTSRKRK